MLISHKHKFIFIHVFKVAGTSIRQALGPYCVPSYRNRLSRKLFGRPKISLDFDHHAKAYEVEKIIGEKRFNNYYSFAFVRNPWDWQVSLYHFTLQNQEHFQHEEVKKMKDFEEYIDWRVHKAMCYQSEFTHGIEGQQLVDFIGKIEHINEEFIIICNRIGVDVHLQKLNKSNHMDYTEYFNPHTYKMISDAYKDEIELFGYEGNFSGKI